MYKTLSILERKGIESIFESADVQCETYGTNNDKSLNVGGLVELGEYTELHSIGTNNGDQLIISVYDETLENEQTFFASAQQIINDGVSAFKIYDNV